MNEQIAKPIDLATLKNAISSIDEVERSIKRIVDLIELAITIDTRKLPEASRIEFNECVIALKAHLATFAFPDVSLALDKEAERLGRILTEAEVIDAVKRVAPSSMR